MQGYWTNATYTPVERPAEFKDQEFFTVAQAQEYAKSAQDRFLSQPDDDPHYDNAIWMVERAQGRLDAADVDRRRSADGRIPPVNAEGKKRADERAAARSRVDRSTRRRTAASPSAASTGPHEGPPSADRLQLEPADLCRRRTSSW